MVVRVEEQEACRRRVREYRKRSRLGDQHGLENRMWDGGPGERHITIDRGAFAPRFALAAVQVGASVYVVGGSRGGTDYLASVERALVNADGSLGAFESQPEMTTPRASIALVAAGASSTRSGETAVGRRSTRSSARTSTPMGLSARGPSSIPASRSL
jgi:hypothetical protein